MICILSSRLNSSKLISTLTLLKSCLVSISILTSRSTHPERGAASSGTTRRSTVLKNRCRVSFLSSFVFIETSTPCLFRHLTRPISFVLVVDDFGVKYHSKVDFDFLVAALSTLYQVKVHPLASQFFGLALHHDTVARTISPSYPDYVDALLLRLRPFGIKSSLSASNPPLLRPSTSRPPTAPACFSLPTPSTPPQHSFSFGKKEKKKLKQEKPPPLLSA